MRAELLYLRYFTINKVNYCFVFIIEMIVKLCKASLYANSLVVVRIRHNSNVFLKLVMIK